MLSRCLRIGCLLFFVLLSVAQAEEPLGRLTRVTRSQQGDRLTIGLHTNQANPEVSAYFLTGPDRLVIECNDTLPEARLPSRPRNAMVRSWKLNRRGLNRARLTLSLNFHPPNSDLKVVKQASAPQVEVSFSTAPGLNEKMDLTEGISWLREDKFLAGRWTRINRLLFDPKDPHVQVAVGLAKEKTNAREKLSSMVERYRAVAGINGGFFAGGGGALGLVYREGRMLVPHVSRRPPRSGFGLTRSGQALFGRLAASGHLIKDLDGGDWSDAWFALGGGPRLIKRGLAKITADLEELGPKGNDITRVAARTVVGLTRDEKLLFVTVAGYRDNHREGVQFGPLVGWLKGLGVQEAVNFDGGASVNMVVGSHIVSDGPANRSKEKPVATALLVKDDRELLFPDSVRWSLGQSKMPADGSSERRVTVSVSTPSGRPVPDGTPVSFFAHNLVVEPALAETSGGKVTVTLRSTLKPGRARIWLQTGPVSDEKRLTLVAGEPTRLLMEAMSASSMEEESMQRVTAKVQVVDQWGNGLAGETLSCSVDGSEQVELPTDRRGVLTLDLELPGSGGLFRVSHPALGARELRIEALRSP